MSKYPFGRMTMNKYFHDAWLKPFLTIEDIAAETGLSHSTMRNWVDRRKIDLVSTHKPGTGGKGVRTLYSMRDVVQFLLLAQLKRISSDFKLDEDQTSYVFGIIQGHIEDKLKGVPNITNTDRFIYIYFDGKKLQCDSSTKADLLYERNEHPSGSDGAFILSGPLQIAGDVWTIIDTISFAETVIRFMKKHKGKLP